MVVLPGGIDDQVGLEIFQHGQHSVGDGVEVAFVGGFRRQGDVDGAAQCAGAAAFTRKASAGIEGAAVLV